MQIRPMSTSTLDQLNNRIAQMQNKLGQPATTIQGRDRHKSPPMPPVISAGTRFGGADRLAKQAKTQWTTGIETGTKIAPASSSISTAPPSTETPPPQPSNYNLDDLIAAWGQESSAYDFDGNGTVGVPDLLHFINHYLKLTESPAPDQTSAPVIATGSASVDSTDAAQDPAAPVPPVITTNDALTRLGVTPDSPKSELGGLNGAAARTALGVSDAPGKSAANSMGGLKSLTDALFTHLSSTGFANQPPTNIRELIDTLNLSPTQSDFMLKSMAEKYPDGLGVNVVA